MKIQHKISNIKKLINIIRKINILEEKLNKQCDNNIEFYQNILTDTNTYFSIIIKNLK